MTSNVDVAAVAVHATNGTSCPVYSRNSSIFQYCGRKLSPPHSSIQWASSIMTAVTRLRKVASFHRFRKLFDRAISGDTYTNCTCPLATSAHSNGELLSSLMKMALRPFASASAAYPADQYNLGHDSGMTLTWSFCRDFKGLITIVTFLFPPRAAMPSNTRLLPYPVPAQKILS